MNASGDAVVVWHRDQLRNVERLIAVVSVGEDPDVAVAGGGIDVHEDPAVDLSTVTDACPARVVWFSRPGP